MDTYKLIVVGSGPAGVKAAQSYLDTGGERPVLLVSTDTTAPYERPPLSKESQRGDHPPEPSPIELDADRVELRLGTRVTDIDLDARTARLGDDVVSFEKLVLAPGMRPRSLPDADDDADVHLLRSFADATSLHQAATHARSAVVVGSGFIGSEAAISLSMRGIDVTMVSPESAPQVGRLGEHAAGAIADILRGYDIDLKLGTEVSQIRAPRTMHLSDGTTLEPDLILVAVGVEPSTDFLEGTALQLHNGRIVTGEQLDTAVEGVYAAGDAARAMNTRAQRALNVEHWGDAESMGEIAGANAAGESRRWDAVPGFWTELGEHTLQYAAWGDGYDELEVVEHPGGFTVWYGLDGELAGVLAYNADADYERGMTLIDQGSTVSAAANGEQPTPPEQAAPEA